MFSRKSNSEVASSSRRKLPFSRKVIWFVVCSLLMSLCTAVFVINGAQKTHAATFTQIWADEFNGSANSRVNTGNWMYDTGTSYPGGAPNWGTGEVETMTNSTANVYQDGAGHLVIKPIKSGNSWTSGRIETNSTSFAAPAGGQMQVVASIQQPNVSGSAAAGYWPAFWMLGAGFRGNYQNWPGIGEIDIMEDINGLSSEFATLHCGTNPGGQCNETTGIGSGQRACSGCQTSFHTYGVIVDRSISPEQIRWYLDGNNFFTVNSNQVDATTWANAVHHGFSIILNVAMGGGFPAAFGGGPTGATQSGVPMLVDYVRVSTTSGGSNPTPTPTPTTGGSCSGTYASGVDNTGSSSARPWFKPCGWSAGYVILHYIRPGLPQQNVYMSYNSGAARWEYNVTGMSSGQNLQYSFTYQRNGLQYDTGVSYWTHP